MYHCESGACCDNTTRDGQQSRVTSCSVIVGIVQCVWMKSDRWLATRFWTRWWWTGAPPPTSPTWTSSWTDTSSPPFRGTVSTWEHGRLEGYQFQPSRPNCEDTEDDKIRAGTCKVAGILTVQTVKMMMVVMMMMMMMKWGLQPCLISSSSASWEMSRCWWSDDTNRQISP